MTSYQWADEDSGGDWNDPQNWEDTTDNKYPSGPPQGGDTVDIRLEVDASITTDGATVASLTDESHTELVGDLTVTDELFGARLTGGAVTAGTLNDVEFDGTTLSAGTIMAAQLDGGMVQADQIIAASVNGATVSAGSIGGEDCALEVSAGTVSAQTLSLDVGSDGFGGELTLTGGSVTFADAATVEGDGGSTAGVIIVSGGRLACRSTLSLGDYGVLNVVGGTVVAHEFTAGESGSALVFVGGSSSHLNVTGDFMLGESGVAVLQVENGGSVVVEGDMETAVQSGATASVKISDPEAQVTIDGELKIGVAGASTWTLDGGVSLTVAGAITLGEESGGSGALTLSDADTMVSGGGGVTLGAAGMGTLTVQSGASFDGSAGDLTLGEEHGAKGSALVTGADSTLTVGGDTTLGGEGGGTLSITGGSATLSGNLTLGESKGANGKLTVNGGQLTLAGDMTVGGSGQGSVIVGPDGVIGPGVSSPPDGANNTITLGEKAGSKGSLTVKGAGASVTSFALTVGGAGAGSLSISDFAVVATSTDADIAELVAGTVQKASITSGAAWNIGGDLTVGEAAIATATVTSGGSVSVGGDLTLGEDTAASGELSIAGSLMSSGGTATPSMLRWGGVLEVGGQGSGTLKITGGAQAFVSSGGVGVVEIGVETGAGGVVTVAGSGSELTGRTLAVGGTLTSAGGAGQLIVDSEAAARFGAAAVWKSGRITVDDGALSLGGTTDDGAITVTSGTVGVTGGFTGSGTVAIGQGGVFALNAAQTSSANRVHITADAGRFNLRGGSGPDLFELAASDLTSVDIVSGGGGTDTIDFTTAGVIAASAFTHVSGVDAIRLANGVNSLTLGSALVVGADSQRLTIYGGTGADTINASAVSGGTLVFSGAGTTQSTVAAGAGTALLTGGAGADTFRFQAAALSSADRVTGGAGTDTLAFTTAGTVAASALAHVSGVDVITLASGTNALTLSEAVVEHSDAGMLTVDGGTGADRITASAVTSGPVVFDGGGGADVIRGGKDENIYKFDNVAGTLAVTNAYVGGKAAHGELEFGAGLSDQSLWLERKGSTLLIDVLGTGEHVTLAGWFAANASAKVGEIIAGGLELDSGVAKLVNAMASFSAHNPGFNPTAPGTTMPSDATLQNAIAAAWHH